MATERAHEAVTTTVQNITVTTTAQNNTVTITAHSITMMPIAAHSITATRTAPNTMAPNITVITMMRTEALTVLENTDLEHMAPT